MRFEAGCGRVSFVGGRAFDRELDARIAVLDRGEYVTAEESLRRTREKSAERMSKYVLSPEADQELNEIWEYIAYDDIDADRGNVGLGGKHVTL